MKRLLLLLRLMAVVTALSLTQQASADDTDEARRHFNQGVELFRSGAYPAALVEFKRAYETVPNYRVLYNVGQTALRLQEFADAVEAYEGYLRAGGDEIPADRRVAVEQELARLRNRVSRVTVTTNATTGEVLVDDSPKAKLPLAAPLRVSAGRRRITIVPRGGSPVSRVIDVAGGDELTVAIDVTLATGAPSTTPESVQEKPAASVSDTGSASRARALPMPALVAGGIALAATAGAVVAGVLALGAKGDADDALGRFPGSRAEFEAARDRMQTRALVADVLAGAALVSGGISVVLFLTDRRSGPATSVGFSVTGLRVATRF